MAWEAGCELVEKDSSSICVPVRILVGVPYILETNNSENEGPDSFSFLTLLKGQKIHERPPVIHHSVNGTFSIRHGKWKMIFSSGSGGRQRPVGKPFEKPYQLYDVEKDPTESQNIIEDHQEVAEILTNYLEQIRSTGTSQNFQFN